MGPKGAGYRSRLPFDIVQIFEKHGFIWGGKWEHFDTMHFESGRNSFESSPDLGQNVPYRAFT
jgi:hypothetical protein